MQLHCITAVTASRGSALTLARSTVLALHHCATTASRGSTPLPRKSKCHVYTYPRGTYSFTYHCTYSGSALTLSRTTLSRGTYSFTWHCTYSGSGLTLARATAAALHHCATTASRGSTLTLARFTVLALHHCATTASRGSTLTLSRAL